MTIKSFKFTKSPFIFGFGIGNWTEYYLIPTVYIFPYDKYCKDSIIMFLFLNLYVNLTVEWRKE